MILLLFRLDPLKCETKQQGTSGVEQNNCPTVSVTCPNFEPLTSLLAKTGAGETCTTLHVGVGEILTTPVRMWKGIGVLLMLLLPAYSMALAERSNDLACEWTFRQ